MNVKTVVKVMNFHSLLRVDAAIKSATMYSQMESELTTMMGIIQNNRNLKLDKRIVMPDPELPALRIFIGSDLGFCGSINTAVSSVLARDTYNEKIIVGRKVRKSQPASLVITREDYEQHFDLIQEYLTRAVRERCWSSVELVYNKFYNVSCVKQEIKRIYPIRLPDSAKDVGNEWDDFEIDGNPIRLLEQMTISCLVYEVKIAAASAFASENIMRQNATSESLKKLDEMEEDSVKAERKDKSQKSFKKTIDIFVNQKSIKG